jgi:hypothetical protein
MTSTNVVVLPSPTSTATVNVNIHTYDVWISSKNSTEGTVNVYCDKYLKSTPSPTFTRVPMSILATYGYVLSINIDNSNC